jgi:hypothetical protein
MRHQLPLALFLAGSTFACVDSSSSSPSDPAEVTSDLEKTNGGLDTADEAPVFGAEAEFDAEQIEPDAAYADAMASDPGMVAIDGPSATNVDGRDVLLLWGRIPGDPNATDWRDWSGTLSLSRGGIIVRRTVAFESRDHLNPRTAIDSVSFASFTRPHADGLALRIVAQDPAASPVVLTYTSTPAAGSTQPAVQYQFDLAQLAAGPIVIDAGDGNKMIAVAQHKHDTDGCVGGFMRGRFHDLPSAAAQARGVGVYHGIVTNRVGEPIGHVRGFYGEKQDGTPVMFGKFITHEGKFLGLIEGTYGNGDFQARWKELGDDDHGRLHGVYFSAAAAGAGHFVARWAEKGCSEDL